ncbi:MAG TPA: magnesium/cobalt transporter CorA [Cyclobacteriaceae bacterium]|jgi:magnesium transporter
MARFLEKQEGKFGKDPGDLTFIGKQRLEVPIIEVFDYSQNHFEKVTFQNLDELSKLKDSDSVSWINIDGLHDIELMQKIGQIFDLHPLLLEDIMNTSQRPKFEEFDNCIFIVLKMLWLIKDSDSVENEHTSFVVGKNFLISFQEGLPGDVFNPIRDRLQRATTKVRNRRPDYLAYALLDVIIDNYIIIIERFGERIELLEGKLSSNPNEELLQEINNYKTEINFLRKTIRPVRELAVSFEKSDSEIIEDENRPYIKSLVDHVAHSAEAIETYQIMLNDQLNVYQTKQSNKLNEILRVLTVFSVIFIPLTFIAGVYGTNFEHFPELEFQYGYYVFWAAMIFTALVMVYFFKRRKWL